MNRFLALLAAAATLGALACGTLAFRAQAGPGPTPLVLNVGDVVRVGGTANVGCKVRMDDRLPTLDCRRAGPLTGSYGTLLNKNEVLVVEFESSKLARIVYSARHSTGEISRCR